MERLGGTSHGSRQINQRPADLGLGAKNLGEHRARTSADVDHGPHRIPSAGDLELRVGRAMPSRPDEGVEGGRDVRMSVQVFPERQSEVFVVGGSACPYEREECAPCVGHAATYALEVQAQTPGGI